MCSSDLPSFFTDLQNAAAKAGITRGVLYRYIVAQCAEVGISDDVIIPKYGKYRDSYLSYYHSFLSSIFYSYSCPHLLSYFIIFCFILSTLLISINLHFHLLFFRHPLGLEHKGLESFIKRSLEIKKFVRTRNNEASDLAKVICNFLSILVF